MTLRKSNVHWAHPEEESSTGTGVVVLSGSSGRLESERSNMLAKHGVTALALRWFGGEGQPSVPCEIPLETFINGLDLLAAECDRLVLFGLSYGAEAAMLTATVDPRVDAVIALAPTDVVWEGHRGHDNDPPQSKWTYRNDPIPFVPLNRSWRPSSSMPAFIEYYELSRATAGRDIVEAATIRVDRISGDLLLVVGGDDKVWHSDVAARQIADHRARVGLHTVIIEDPRAGHTVVLPGEIAPALNRRYQVGGDESGPHRLGEMAWPAIRRLLRPATGSQAT